MRSGIVKCKKCKNAFPSSFRFCPLDGLQLNSAHLGAENAAGARWHFHSGDMISVRKLMVGLGILLLVPLFALTADFMYHHLRPKYGQLVIRTSPEGATIFLDGHVRGVAPLTVVEVPSGTHRIKVVKNGYKGYAQNVDVFQYATHSVRLTLERLIPMLPNKHLAELESWRFKLAQALKRRSLVSPAADNALYFANKILEIDSGHVYAREIRRKIGESLRKTAEPAYASQDWPRAERYYKNLVLAFPGDAAIAQRLAEITAENRARTVEREKLLSDWTAKADEAIKTGSLIPPEKDNAMDALRNIQQLDTNNSYARATIQRIKEMLQSRAEAKLTQQDLAGARQDFKVVLQYFPDDTLSQSRLDHLEEQILEQKPAGGGQSAVASKEQ